MNKQRALRFAGSFAIRQTGKIQKLPVTSANVENKIVNAFPTLHFKIFCYLNTKVSR